jgi:hypothetical protein
MNYVIGIDPDAQKSGVALVEVNRIVEMQKMSLPELIEYCVEMAVSHDVTVKIEDVESWKNVRQRPGQNFAAMRKISQNVGQVKQAARSIVEMLISKGITPVMVKPLRGPIKQAKKNSAYFNKVTGWTGRSNEDCRDAALIALFGGARNG